MTKFGWTMLFAILSWSSCGDKESSNSTNANTNGENAAFCQIGTSGCGCSSSFPCTVEGDFCVEGMCQPCPAGDEHCACKEDQSCNGALVCTDPDPTCPALCDPFTCEMPGDANAGGTCGPTELCARTINECGEALTQESCELFYADSANCADMPTYTTCNCDCITQDTCENYFACGQNCFNDHCN